LPSPFISFVAFCTKNPVPAPLVQTQTNKAPFFIEITLEGIGGPIYYTLDGSDPRLPGGRISSKALQYEGPLAIKENVKLFARIRGDVNLWSAPTASALQL